MESFQIRSESLSGVVMHLISDLQQCSCGCGTVFAVGEHDSDLKEDTSYF